MQYLPKMQMSIGRLRDLNNREIVDFIYLQKSHKDVLIKEEYAHVMAEFFMAWRRELIVKKTLNNFRICWNFRLRANGLANLKLLIVMMISLEFLKQLYQVKYNCSKDNKSNVSVNLVLQVKPFILLKKAKKYNVKKINMFFSVRNWILKANYQVLKKWLEIHLL